MSSFQGGSHWLQQEEPTEVNECIIDFVETENSNLYLDDVIPHSEEDSDTLDEIGKILISLVWTNPVLYLNEITNIQTKGMSVNPFLIKYAINQKCCKQ